MNELKEALKAWGAQHVRLIKDRENAVHEVRVGKERAALRLHRPGYMSAAAIRSELDWMGALSQAGMEVPAPISSRDGQAVIALSTGRLATMVTWVDGQPIGDGGVPFDIPVNEQVALYHKLGRELARLHNITDTLTLPQGFTRHRWDLDGLLGETPFWGRFWESPALPESDRHLVNRARAVAQDRAQAYLENGADFGLIHADALRENVFIKDGELMLIDFDDAGFGFRLYELAVMMTQNEDEPAADQIRDAAIAGYRELRDFSAEAEELLPMFIMLRRFASMGWAVPRYELSDPTLIGYTERAVAAARQFLA
ncbi:phosphotransferase enzyme family protein [Aliiroseovarius crassostreae]|uniref:phosphotransferase enzyme family protein n=1 Tax=Aliiroseovarius crassostreae TaxID=154981 RepID=UPI00220D9C4B|nr:phosphotransferase [Aliiroseovarius crassostreae]UWQ08102.1 phosphotransferase [Aliiroseovarius crassostreae]